MTSDEETQGFSAKEDKGKSSTTAQRERTHYLTWEQFKKISIIS